MTRAADERTATILRDTVRFPIAVRIRVIGGDAKPNLFRLGSGACVVGAGKTADIVVVDSTVSRRHVELSLAPEGVQLVDLGSRNGTFYLGQRVERMTLALGSRVKVGPAELILEADEEALASRPGEGPEEYRGLVGSSTAMRQLFAKLTRLEGSLVNILILGESGVGKELIAQAIHDGSSHCDQPFVPINCGALPRDLVASELFGHKKGAFTGAMEARQGAFERADGGTLFLDEVGELPLDVQPTLLRALESGEIRAVGSDQTKRVKVRIVAATNRQLAEDARAGRFREDLYFRLAVVSLPIPPLRERVDDIPRLAARFAAAESGTELPADLLSELASRAWPGNVRELRNAVQSYLALGDLPERTAGADDELDSAMRKAVDLERPYADQKDEVAARFTHTYLQALMRKTSGNQTEAARLAGLDRGYLGKLLAKHGISR